MKNNEDVTHAIADLIQLHDEVLARVFAIQTLLEDLGLVSSDEVRQRTEQLRKQFELDLEARFAALEEKSDAK